MERKSKKPALERKFQNAVESQFRTINLSADRSAIMKMQLERKSDFQVGAQYVAQLKKKPNGAQVQKRGRSAIPNKKSEHNSIFLSEKKCSKCIKSATGAQLKNATPVCQSECNFKNAPELNLSL